MCDETYCTLITACPEAEIEKHAVCTKALDFNSKPHIKQFQSFIISVQLIVFLISCEKLKQTNKRSKKSWNSGLDQRVMNFSCENTLYKISVIRPAD